MSYTYAEGFIDAAGDGWTCTPAAATKTGSTYTYSGTLTPEQVNSPDFNILIAETAGADGALIDIKGVAVRFLYTVPLTASTQVGRFGTSYASVAYGGGNTVVICGGRGVIRRSTDSGATWASVNSGTSANLRKITWDGSQFMIVGDAGTVLISSDGLSWTRSQVSIVSSIMGVTRSPTSNIFIIVGAQNINRISGDGVTWL